METLIFEGLEYLLKFIVSDPQHAIPLIIVAWILWRAIHSASSASRGANLPSPPAETASSRSPMLSGSGQDGEPGDFYQPPAPLAGQPSSVFDSGDAAAGKAALTQTAADMQQQRDAMQRQENERLAAQARESAVQAAAAAGALGEESWTLLERRLGRLDPVRANIIRAILFSPVLERPRRYRGHASGRASAGARPAAKSADK